MTKVICLHSQGLNGRRNAGRSRFWFLKGDILAGSGWGVLGISTTMRLRFILRLPETSWALRREAASSLRQSITLLHLSPASVHSWHQCHCVMDLNLFLIHSCWVFKTLYCCACNRPTASHCEKLAFVLFLCPAPCRIHISSNSLSINSWLLFLDWWLITCKNGSNFIFSFHILISLCYGLNICVFVSLPSSYVEALTRNARVIWRQSL